MSNEKEIRIREARTIEATRKNLMGLSGKLGVILRNLGQPIISTTEGDFMADGDLMFGYSSQRFGESTWNDDDPNELPTSEDLDELGNPKMEPYGDEWSAKKNARRNYIHQIIGFYFDGLDRGVHMDIKYMKSSSEIVMYWKGYKVYQEISGTLVAYAPQPEWEAKIDSLYNVARKADEKQRKNKQQEDLEQATKNKKSWIQKMKEVWGI